MNYITSFAIAILFAVPHLGGSIGTSAKAGSKITADTSATTIASEKLSSLGDKGGLSVSKHSEEILTGAVFNRLNDIQKAIDDKKAADAQAIVDAQNAAQASSAPQSTPVEETPTPIVSAPTQSDDYYVNWIIQHESGGDPYAVNATSGACGLFQRLPCTVILGDVAGQMADGLAYINSRYGSPYNAYLYWIAHGNY